MSNAESMDKSPADARADATLERLELDQVMSLKEELLARTVRGDVQLDLGGVTACDLAGLQLLWAAAGSARGHGHRFAVASPSPTVVATAAVFGFDLTTLQEQP